MLKKLFVLILVLAPMATFAQDKVAFVNWQEVFSKMPEMAEVESTLTKKGEAMQATLASIQKEYEAKLAEYQKDTTTVSESILMDRTKVLQQLEERYQAYMQQSRAEMEQEQQKLITPLQEKLMNAIKAVGDENGYTYIISRESLLYISPSAIDANPKVKAKLNIKD